VSHNPLFQSFFQGGFECSTHRPRSRHRLDLIAATGHDTHAAADYARVRTQGIRTLRDGIRWHLIERTPSHYDFRSALPMVRAAHDAGVQVIWDLCHYGWPDDLDVFSPKFVRRFAELARAFTRLLTSETDMVPFVAPVNEISFFAWAGGEVAYFNPFVEGRAYELKAQLVRASIAAIEAVWEAHPGARVVHTDPVIHVHADPERPQDRAEAEAYTRSQFDSWDMLAGRLYPEVGGHPRYLDIVGVNYYPHNQWIFRDLPFNPDFAIGRDHPQYRRFRHILADVHQRYGRPMFVAETGAGDEHRPGWLRYIGHEVRAAMQSGVPIEGVCLYPIVNFPWWDDGHHLHNGLWDAVDAQGEREIYQPLARELARQQRRFARMCSGNLSARVG
jgi:beta-glucosidase/6-phospho-beta-glucosidase/beta-galactosidase